MGQNALNAGFLTLFEGFPSPTETIRRAAVYLRSTFKAEGVSLLLYSKSQRSLVYQLVSGGTESLEGAHISEGIGSAWWAAENGYTVIHDCQHDERFSSLQDKTDFITRNMIAFPFSHQGEAMGVIELVNLDPNMLDAPETEAQANFFAGFIGVAYSAALLQNRLRLQKHQLEEANRDLERRVEVRTHELHVALSDVQEKNELLRRTQTQLVQTEKMAALGLLSAGVAHEINNPIGFISSNLYSAKSYWQNLRNYLTAVSDPDSQSTKIYREKYDIDAIEEDMPRLIEECLEGTLRVTNIVRNLKEFAHQGQSQTKRFNAHELMDRTLAIALSPFKHRIEVCKEYGAKGEIVGDGQRLGQVIMNLAVNAAQAINGDGRILFRTMDVGEQLVIEIEDSGCGIPEENLSKIFEPFFTTKEVGEGTGLGLSTCFHLAQQSGGELTVKSEVGVGTTFRLALPLEMVTQQEA